MKNIKVIEYENLKLLNERFFPSFKKNIDNFLNSGWFILGNQVKKFESDYSNFCGTDYCVGVASGLDALVIALNSLKYPEGTEVIVPSNTYIATILAVIRNNYVPVLVEPDINTYNIDPNKIEQSITKKTKAILVTHLYGKPCEMKKIIDISENYKLDILEDCAQAHGAKYNNQTVGSFGIGCHSFYPTKNLGALGDGGAITTNNEKLRDKFKSLRNYGSNTKYYNDEIGYNSRLDEIQACFLNEKLKFINTITNHKRNLAEIYDTNLHKKIIKPVRIKNCFDVFHIYNIRIDNRDGLRQFLLENGVKTEIHYPIAPNKQKGYRKFFNKKYPISELIHRTTLSLPISLFHTKSDIIKVCDLINNWFSKSKNS